MTSFLANQVGGVFTPLVAKDKGDINNRAKCAGAQLVNNAQTLASDVVVLGGTGAAAYGIQKSGKFAKVLSKPVDFFANILGKLSIKMRLKEMHRLGLDRKTTGDTIKIFSKRLRFCDQLADVTKAIKSAPAKVKAMVTLGYGVLVPALTYIVGKHYYKQGQIDQKYTDRAKVERHTTNVIDR